MEGVTVRFAEPEDVDAATSLWWLMAAQHRDYLIPYFDLNDEESCKSLWRKHFFSLLDYTDAGVWVAEVEGQVVGLLIARVRERPPIYSLRMEMEIDSAVVHPDFRRRGALAKMMEIAADWGAINGACHCVLEVAEGNPAEQAYDALGFEPVMRRMVRPLEIGDA